MMRDEEKYIAQMLSSVLDVIGDRLAGIVLVDTGSIDNTVQIAKAVLLPMESSLEICEIQHHPWVNFGMNRTQLLRITRDLVQYDDYLLMIDADTIIEGSLPDILEGDGYELEILGVGSISYRQPLLLSARKEWEYIGAVHEYLGNAVGLSYIDSLKVRNNGNKNHVADGRFERDRQALMDSIDKRNLFYLAQTERDLGNSERASDLYDLRASLGGWNQEVYYSMWQAAKLRGSLEGLLAAFEFCPSRGESLYDALTTLRSRSLWRPAYSLGKLGTEIQTPADHSLFIEPWVYAWGLKFEYSIACYYVGEYQECVEVSEELLSRELPMAYHEAAAANIDRAKSAEAQFTTKRMI